LNSIPRILEIREAITKIRPQRNRRSHDVRI
jgi:hypothetical protein